MAKIFDDILLKGVRSGKIPNRTKEAIKWYRKESKKIRSVKNARAQLRQGDGNADRFTARWKVGEMYHMKYIAKHKNTLPYWDVQPLIFPIGRAKGGFYGINFHYINSYWRAKLMDALYETVNNKKFDESTRLKISYKVLKNAAKFKAFKPCIKHYLTKQKRGQFFRVNSSEWDIALFLPVANFVNKDFSKVKNAKVWKDSRKKF